MSYNPYDQQKPGMASPYAQYDEPQTDYTKPAFPDNSAEIRVEKVIFIPTGTYNDQWLRPWTTNYNTENASSVHEVVAAAYHDHQQKKRSGAISSSAQYMVDPSILAGVSASFLQPAARGEVRANVNIHGGWQNQTGRFMLVLAVKRAQVINPVHYVVIGYTDHLGFSQSNIDPQMQMTINTIFEVIDVEVNRGYGLRIEQQMRATNQVLIDFNYSGPDEANAIRLRPYEVAMSLARNADSQLQGAGVLTRDTRIQQNATPEFSNQRHTNPNDYMAKILSGLVNGRDFAEQTNRTGVLEPYHEAGKLLRDSATRRDPFIAAISRQSNNGQITGTFSWRDLLRIDPNAERDEVCFIQWRDRLQFTGSIGENMHEAGSTAQWGSRDLTTQSASQIANMLPSMMSDQALRKVRIFASNLNNMPVCYVTEPVGIISGVDLTPQMLALQALFEQQVVAPLTFNGQIAYNMDISADLFGEISITMKLDADHPATYVQPAYCSSAVSPILTTSVDTLDRLSNSFHHLQQAVLQPVHRPLVLDAIHSATPTTRRY